MLQNEPNLIQKAKKGDPEAFTALYESYQPVIYRYLFYRVDDPACAEDLTAEVFVRMVEHIDRFNPQGQTILAWLYTIAHNLLTDHYRRSGKTTELPAEELLGSDENANPARIAESHLTQAELRAALQELTEEQRQVVLLKFVAEQSNAEIGTVMNKPEGAIKSLQHRALAALRRVLEGSHGRSK